MLDHKLNARLGWLSLTLGHQRHALSKLLLRLKDVGTRIGTSLGLQHKFMSLMEQIAYDKEIEQDILSEIEEVERLHNEMKQKKLLRHPDPFPPQASDLRPQKDDEPKPQRKGIWSLLGLIALFSPRPIKHKKQDLTVD